MSQREHPHRAGSWDWITFLITGPDENLYKFQAPVEFFDRRGQTCRCRAHDFDGDRGMRNYNLAVEEAKRADVTMQDLVCGNPKGEGQTHLLGGGATVTVRDMEETYPIVNFGSHGMKWPPENKKQQAHHEHT